VVKLLVGLLKGAVIGGAIGYGAFALAQATGFGNAWLTYGVVGALVGLFVGRPLWSLIRDSHATSWIAILKGAFGFGVGCGLYALLGKAWGPTFAIAGEPAMWPPFVGGAIGAVYGGFVEIDDAVGDGAVKKDGSGESGKAAKSGPAGKPKQLRK
jgi:hypothetical protein